jgi:hypothetical protein
MKLVILIINYHIESLNLRTFFSSLAAEKSGCVKYAHFPAFGPRNVLLSFCVFFNNSFVFSNNARWIPEFQIPFVLHGSRIVPRNLSLLICTTLYNCYSSFSSLNFNTSAHYNCWKATEIFTIYNCTVLLTITPRATAPYFQGLAAVSKYGI